MHRLFVAIRPPSHIRDLLLDVMEGVPGASWQNEDQLHLTLRFIGEVDRRQAEDIAAALGTIRYPAFKLSLNGLDVFGRAGQPVTLWAGVTPHDDLKVLHKKVDQAIVRTGMGPDRRAYTPHITLARLKRGMGPLDRFFASAGGLSSAPFLVDFFALYESELTTSGAIYTIIERYPLVQK